MSMQPKLRVGAHIRKWRSLRGMKQKDLACALGIAESSMSNLENDIADITLLQLERVSELLEISIPELFTDPGDALKQPVKHDFIPQVADQELLYAVIKSMEQKDQQMQAIVQDVLQALTELARVKH